MALNCVSPDLCPLSSYDCRHEPPLSGSWFSFNFPHHQDEICPAW
jgi:hypothetical protein